MIDEPVKTTVADREAGQSSALLKEISNTYFISSINFNHIFNMQPRMKL
jgi:hypothetical protein